MAVAPLHELLTELVEDEEDTWKVYFQPPSNIDMSYPCITVKRSRALTTHADNAPHVIRKGYQVTIITDDPLSGVPDKVAKLPTAEFERFFAVDNLNHDVYNLYP